MFDADRIKNDCVAWIRAFFKTNGPGCNAVVGISGGKDSSTVAALCAQALGKDRVIGVLMPCGEQPDIDMSYLLVRHLRIPYYVINIKPAADAVLAGLSALPEISAQARINLPARIRMSTLYAVSQSLNGRVANTCNLSEDYVGYATRYGDGAGDFSPLCNMTVSEVKAVARTLGLPDELIEKTPIDGLSGKTDEENLGFSYDELDEYIRKGRIANVVTQTRIKELHQRNLFKLEQMPGFCFREA